MVGEYALMDWLKYLIRKWKLAFVIVLVCVVGFVGVKFMVKSPLPVSGPQVIVSEMITFPSHHQYTSAEGVESYLRYDDIWMRNPVLSEFITLISEKYDMTAFDEKWDKLSDHDRAQWIRDRYVCNPMLNSPTYEITLKTKIDAASPEIYETLTAEWELLFRDFIDYIAVSTAKYTGDSSMVKMGEAIQKSAEQTPETINIKLLLKHAVLGCAFGIIFSVFLLSIRFLMDSKIHSVALIDSRYHPNTFKFSTKKTKDLAYYITNFNATAVSVIIDTLSNVNLFEALIADSKGIIEKLRVVNLSNYTLQSMEGIDIVQKDKIENTQQLRKILQEQNQESLYTLVYADSFCETIFLAEVLQHSGQGIVLAKIGSTPKQDLENVFRVVKEYTIDTKIIVAWEE